MALSTNDEEAGEGRPKRSGTVVSSSVLQTRTSQPSRPKDRFSAGFSRFTSSIDNSFKRCWSRYVHTINTSFVFNRGSPSVVEDGVDRDNDSFDDTDSDDDNNGTTFMVRKIHRQPQGYPRLASFLDSDERFMVYRRFGYLGSRLLLQRQDEIAELELQLDAMESKEARNPQTADRLTSRRYMTDAKNELFARLETSYNAYAQLLQNASTMAAMNRPTSGEQRHVMTWLLNTKPIEHSERDFVRYSEDLVTLRPGRERAWLDTAVEKMLSLRLFGRRPLRRLFQSKDTRKKSNGKDGVYFYIRSRIENFVMSIITLVVLILLIVPIWLLFKLSENRNSHTASLECIGVLLVSTLAFSASMSLFTSAKRQEILASAAAYCAVLVVFFGNLGTPDSANS